MSELTGCPDRVRRAAIVLRPTERFAAWVGSLGYVPRAAIDGLRRAPPVFLVPEEFAVVPGPFLEERWPDLLALQLASLGVAPEHRPAAPGPDLFRQWFAVDHHREVHDLAG